MTALWVLGTVAALLTILCLIRVGAVFRMEDALSVTLRLGPFQMQVFPAKKKKKAEKKAEKAQKNDGQKPKKTLPKPAFVDVCDAIRTLWSPLKRALDRTRRGVRIHPLDLSVVLGGAAEPADAARLFGEVNGAVWTVMPVLEGLLVIPEPHIHMDVDFTTEQTAVRGTVGFTARMGTLLRIGSTMAVPALKWLLAYRKKHQTIRKDESDGYGKEKPAA